MEINTVLRPGLQNKTIDFVSYDFWPCNTFVMNKKCPVQKKQPFELFWFPNNNIKSQYFHKFEKVKTESRKTKKNNN